MKNFAILVIFTFSSIMPVFSNADTVPSEPVSNSSAWRSLTITDMGDDKDRPKIDCSAPNGRCKVTFPS